MVKPPTSVYYPFDSEAPAVFRASSIDNYIATAFIVVMMYDHIITLDKEIAWIWTLKWRLPKFLFLMNRYIISPLIVLIGIVDFIFPITLSFCDVIVHLAPWVAVLSFGIAEGVLILRVCALYGQRKLFVWLVVGLFAIEIISVIVNTSILMGETRQLYYYEFLPGCWSNTAGSGIYSFWIPFTIFDGIVMLLTLYKVFPLRNSRSPAVSLLARDSVVYFVILFSALVINEVVYKLGIPYNLMLPAECIACISISRMMMNIRGLVMDDPGHTAYLQSLSFQFLTAGDSIGQHRAIRLQNVGSEALSSPTIKSATYEAA